MLYGPFHLVPAWGCSIFAVSVAGTDEVFYFWNKRSNFAAIETEYEHNAH